MNTTTTERPNLTGKTLDMLTWVRAGWVRTSGDTVRLYVPSKSRTRPAGRGITAMFRAVEDSGLVTTDGHRWNLTTAGRKVLDAAEATR